MWECQNCGEKENEDSFKFCLSCGAAKFNSQAIPAAEEDVKNAFNSFIDYTPAENMDDRSEEDAIPERRWHIPKTLSDIGHKVKGVLNINDTDLNHVKLSPATQDKMDALVQAGVFENKAEAAAYLIEQGIKAEVQLFDVVEQKLSEIERLRSELRALVKDSRSFRKENIDS
jgi:Arc/MetJ-type ribon-helix-helix transcriptional regulator